MTKGEQKFNDMMREALRTKQIKTEKKREVGRILYGEVTKPEFGDEPLRKVDIDHHD